MLSSRDGSTWTETRVSSTSFDIGMAPLTGMGYFLGDDHGVVTAGTAVLPVFVATTASADNRTDVFAPRLAGLTGVNAAHAARALGVPLYAVEEDALRRDQNAAVALALERRMPGWQARAAALARTAAGDGR